MAYSDWKEITVNVSEVLLDSDNPRLFIESPTQENILIFLANEEDAIELAKQISLNRGLPLAEKPVLTIENGKYVVLEGNRRICACKLLLEPSLLPSKKRGKIPKIDWEMRNYLENLPVVLTPDRNSTEAFITMRHSGDRNVKKWSTIASIKRFVNRYTKGETITDIAKVLDEKTTDVKNGIRFFYFLEFVRNEINWTEDEKQKLAIYKLETSKLDRFLPFSRKAKNILKIDFTDDHKVVTALPMDKFKAALKIIISRVYLRNGTKDEIDTRTKMDVVFNAEILEICKVPPVVSDETKGEQKAMAANIEGEKSENDLDNNAIKTGDQPDDSGISVLEEGRWTEEPNTAEVSGGEKRSDEYDTSVVRVEVPPNEPNNTMVGINEVKVEGDSTENIINVEPKEATIPTAANLDDMDSAGSNVGKNPVNSMNTNEHIEQGISLEIGQSGTTMPQSTAIGQAPTSGRVERSATNEVKYINLTGAYPFTNKYRKNARINTLIRELKGITYKDYRMSSMYLIRSLLETYTHEYIDHFVKDENRDKRIKGVPKERVKRTQTLKELLYNSIKIHLKEYFPEFGEEIELLEITFTDNNNAAATKIINFYIHSQTQVPDYLELLDAWKKVSAILKCLDEILYTRTS